MPKSKGDFARGRISKRIIAQVIPLLLAELVHMTYNIVDRIYIGRMNNDAAMAGVGIIFPFVTLVSAFTALLGHGSAPLFAILRGEGNDKKAERVLGTSFTLMLTASVVLTALCFAFKKPILYLFGASDSSFIYANQYLEIYLIGTVFAMLSSGLNAYINAEGAPRTAMLTTAIGAFTNIVLDPIFIFTLGMGVRGAALATLISQTVSAIWVILFLVSKRAPIRIRLSSMLPTLKITKKIIVFGIPLFIMQATNTLVSVTCNSTLQIYGKDTYVSIMTMINSVREVLTLPISALTNGACAVIAYNFGARLYTRVRNGIKFTCAVGIVYTALAWLTVVLAPGAFIGIFTPDERIVSLGSDALRIYFFGFVFMALQIAGQAVFQALGYAKKAIFFSLLRKAIIVFPLTLLLPRFGFGVNGVFLAEPISNLVGGLICFSTMFFTVYLPLKNTKDECPLDGSFISKS